MSEESAGDLRLLFIETLRAYHESDGEQRGELASALANAIITKQVDVEALREELRGTGEQELADTLDRLLDLIEPDREEDGSNE
jgi:hypothetical protein